MSPPHSYPSAKIKVRTSYIGYPTALRFRGSVIPSVVVPTFILTLWALLVFLINKYIYSSFYISQTVFITITSFVLSLLLAFRTNTAYDRYWEGCRLWSTLLCHSRNLTRLIWVSVSSSSLPEIQDKKEALRLLLATFISFKNRVRGEYGLFMTSKPNPTTSYLRPEFQGLIPVSDMKSKTKWFSMFTQEHPYLPQALLFLLSTYFMSMNQANRLDVPNLISSINILNGMTEGLASLERILYTPMPTAYRIHLKQCVYLYLIVLPLQLHSTFQALSILITALVTFTFIGVDLIGSEIENPFGTDANDLPLDRYVAMLRDEIHQVMTPEFQVFKYIMTLSNANIKEDVRFFNPSTPPTTKYSIPAYYTNETKKGNQDQEEDEDTKEEEEEEEGKKREEEEEEIMDTPMATISIPQVLPLEKLEVDIPSKRISLNLNDKP